MNILVINTGSSSFKYQLINADNDKVLAKGLAERIGTEGGRIKHSWTKDGKSCDMELVVDLPEHHVAFEQIAQLLTAPDTGVIHRLDDIEAIGHRVVHGGEHFVETQVITPEVKQAIAALIPLAPLHNPVNLIGIEAAEKSFPAATQIAVFDTAFHHTMPEKAFRYALPEKFYKENGIRAYGFHGTSHKYVYEKSAEYLHKKDLKAITIHLGNGASMCAVNEKGESVETSMGFSALCGLIMGTRTGDMDPSIIFHMAEELQMPPEAIKNILYKESGMLALAGSNDARDVSALYHKGDENAILCYEMYTHRIKKYIGAYIAVLNGADAIIFSAGICENDALTRLLTCKNMEALGINISEEANTLNNHPSAPVEIQSEDSRVKILIVPTNEELEIAHQSYRLIQKLTKE